MNEGRLAAQEAGLIRIENRHQLYLGQIESLAKQVDADQAVEDAFAEVGQDFDTLKRLHVAVDVLGLNALAFQKLG